MPATLRLILPFNQLQSRTNFDMCRAAGIGGVCLFVFLSFCLFVFLSFCLFVFLSFCLFVFLSFTFLRSCYERMICRSLLSKLDFYGKRKLCFRQEQGRPGRRSRRPRLPFRPRKASERKRTPPNLFPIPSHHPSLFHIIL